MTPLAWTVAVGLPCLFAALAVATHLIESQSSKTAADIIHNFEQRHRTAVLNMMGADQ